MTIKHYEHADFHDKSTGARPPLEPTPAMRSLARVLGRNGGKQTQRTRTRAERIAHGKKMAALRWGIVPDSRASDIIPDMQSRKVVSEIMAQNGRRGAKAANAGRTKAERTEIAKKAANARWRLGPKALRVACPLCNAEPGQLCRERSGFGIEYFHAVRRKAGKQKINIYARQSRMVE